MAQPQHPRLRKLPLSLLIRLNGVFYLTNMWNALKNSFNLPLPNVAITCGWPSRRSRGRFANRAPGEVITNKEWKGTEAEKAFVSVHPERFEDVEQVALSVLYIVGNEVYGSRRNLGALTLGVTLNKESGMLEYVADDKGKHAKTVLNQTIKQLGALPQGFADIPEPKVVARNRQRKYACGVCGQIIRSATDALAALCMHAGTPQAGQQAAPFALQVPATRAATTQTAAPTTMAARRGRTPAAAVAPAASAAAAAAAIPPPAPGEGPMGPTNVRNVARAIKAGAARMSQSTARNFGAEAAPAA